MDMVFRYRHDPGGIFYKGMPGGCSVTIFRNGDVVQCDYVVGFEKSIKRKALAAQPELARTVAEIIARNSDKLKGIELCCDVVKMAENLCSTVAGTFPNVVKYSRKDGERDE